jgi:hypothetical protein
MMPEVDMHLYTASHLMVLFAKRWSCLQSVVEWWQ